MVEIGNISEHETRKKYIDSMLIRNGWKKGINWLDEYQVSGMPTSSGTGYIDYLLLGDDGIPLAIIEAKKTTVDLSTGRYQAKLYADCIEKEFHIRPVIFLCNGYETRIINGKYPERRVSEVYSQRDLSKMKNIQSIREPLIDLQIDDNISNRCYQKEAIQSVCDTFSKNKRKALLVMATGSGKTRTVISIVDVLIHKGWIKNILFLADRTSLVRQAKRNFVNLLPNQSCSNLCDSKPDYNARIIFSTYQTMINCVDTIKSQEGDRLYSCGHFDLIICDEVHRSIYNKYHDILEYFDSLLIGLTATPKDDVDKNTYDIFKLETGVPTYSYELSQAVKYGYLVDFISIESETKFLTQGIHYDELPENEKEQYENLFTDENGNLPKEIDSQALNDWLFNRDTIKKVLKIVMDKGIKIHYGNDIGKTIIFAKNQDHAEKILEVWKEEYPNYNDDYCQVITYNINFADKLIEQFEKDDKYPQIAISVDMLDTGIDIPSCLNLVFFKKVMSKAKFWQMIGRGTRLCPNLIDGKDKENFRIFDFCDNFEFFRMNPQGQSVGNQMSLTQRLFQLKVDIIYKLQEFQYQTMELKELRSKLVNEVVQDISILNKKNFAVNQHLQTVERFNSVDKFKALKYEDTLEISQELSALILCSDDEIHAQRFDALMYAIELANLMGKNYKKGKLDLVKKAKALSKVSNIIEINSQKDIINTLINTPEYLNKASISDFEHIRTQLRNLIKYIPQDSSTNYESNFTDDILKIEEHQSELDTNDFISYKQKVNTYIHKNEDNPVIQKLRTNQSLNQEDISQLETILWSEIGTKEEYQKEYGNKSLGVLIREIIGLDMNTAKEQFSKFLNNSNLDYKQMYFINQVVEYIVHNGVMMDFSVMQETPFIDVGNISDIFADLSLWLEIKNTIKQINQNAITILIN